MRPEADQGSASFWPLLRLRLRLEPSSASKVGMTGEKVTSDDRRKRCVDNVEGDEVELVTGGCVSKAAVDSADAFHTAAARDVHLFANLRKMRCFALFLRILRKTKQHRAI